MHISSSKKIASMLCHGLPEAFNNEPPQPQKHRVMQSSLLLTTVVNRPSSPKKLNIETGVQAEYGVKCLSSLMNKMRIVLSNKQQITISISSQPTLNPLIYEASRLELIMNDKTKGAV